MSNIWTSYIRSSGLTISIQFPSKQLLIKTLRTKDHKVGHLSPWWSVPYLANVKFLKQHFSFTKFLKNKMLISAPNSTLMLFFIFHKVLSKYAFTLMSVLVKSFSLHCLCLLSAHSHFTFFLTHTESAKTFSSQSYTKYLYYNLSSSYRCAI